MGLDVVFSCNLFFGRIAFECSDVAVVQIVLGDVEEGALLSSDVDSYDISCISFSIAPVENSMSAREIYSVTWERG